MHVEYTRQNLERLDGNPWNDPLEKYHEINILLLKKWNNELQFQNYLKLITKKKIDHIILF